MILNSISHDVGDDGMRHSFMFSTRQNARSWEKNLGAEIYYSYSQLTLAALYVRSSGPLYLKALSIDTVRKMLTDFLADNYHGIGRETWFTRSNDPFDQLVSEPTKQEICGLLASSSIFMPENHVSLFPLVPVHVSRDFSSAPFFFRAPRSLLDEIDTSLHRYMQPNQFPPQEGWEGSIQVPAAWLGVRSPHEKAAVKIRSAVLGAISLTINDGHRHMFSMRKVFGNFCTLHNGITPCPRARILLSCLATRSIGAIPHSLYVAGCGLRRRQSGDGINR